MPWKQDYRSDRFTGLVTALLILFAVFPLFSEDFSGRIILEKTNFVVGEEFPLSILVPGAAPLMLSIETPKIPGGIRLLKGPYMRPGKSGTVVNYYFRIEKPGRYVLGSFALKTALATGYTPPVFIKAGKNDFQLSGIDDVPPNVKWAVPIKTYYPGEIIPMMFVVENLEYDDLSLESSIYSNNSGIVRHSSRYGVKEEKTVLQKNILTGSIYDILYHNHIFIPVFPGTVPLPAAEIFLSKDGKSYGTFLPEKKIVITPVPSRIRETGAIGDFESNYTLSGDLLHHDEIIVVKRVLEGSGNFYAINVPAPYTNKPELVEINLLKENLTAVPSGQWFDGTLTVRFSLKLKKSVKNKINESVILTVPDMTVMKIRDEFGDNRRYDFYTLKGGTEKINLTSSKREFMYPEESVTEALEAETDFSVILIISGILIIFTAAFIYGLKNRNRFAVVSAIVFIAVSITVFTIYIFNEKEVYGIISSDSEFAGIYTVPDENSSIKYSASAIDGNMRVSVKGSSKGYYLVELSDGGEGWIKKEYIRLENE